ncbi:urease accessory protein UreF [Rhodophyticola sp. CCM32]|uniref:urease accessory protein UreF n=1 Tax=Rhodophyticola sp. CCM32 TaxID=2916397 RepID=UPI001EE4ED3A|nr:urease accessory UreF family protein [Rhodophyticola sp. CCM32]
MPIETGDLLTLTQWLSPGFPISAYAYSHGLETAMAEGKVQDSEAVRAWIATVIAAGAGRNDAILLCLALRDAEETGALADLAEALAGSAERWEETRAQGVAFAETLRAMGRDIPDLPYPVVVGHAARDLALPPNLVAELFLHGFAANLVSAAVRFMPLGQAAGQGVLTALHPVIRDVAAEAALAGADDLGGAAFAADLAAMTHETQEVRLFRS